MLFQNSVRMASAPCAVAVTAATHGPMINACNSNPAYSSGRRNSDQRRSQAMSASSASPGTSQPGALLAMKPTAAPRCMSA